LTVYASKAKRRSKKAKVEEKKKGWRESVGGDWLLVDSNSSSSTSDDDNGEPPPPSIKKTGPDHFAVRERYDDGKKEIQERRENLFRIFQNPEEDPEQLSSRVVRKDEGGK